MKPTALCSIPLVLLTVAATGFAAEKDIVIRRSVTADSPHHVFVSKHGDGEIKKEKVTFLGVQTAPVGRALAAQLGLPADTGLVVNEVVDDSPAAGVLKEHDVLTRLGDQILIDQHQLSVLIRQKKEGDEVSLTLVRGGKEQTVKVKLGQREMPVAGMFNLEPPPDGRPGFQWFGNDLQGMARLRELPGLEPGAVDNVVRIIGNARGQMLEGPGVHVFSRRGKGTTILDLPQGNMVYSDDDGSVEVKADDGKRDLTVKDAKGAVIFEGPIATKEDREKLPAEIKERIHRIEKASFSFEVGDDFKFEGADVRQPAVPPQKIRLVRPPTLRPVAGARAF